MAYFGCGRRWLSIGSLVVAMGLGCTRDNPAFGDEREALETSDGTAASAASVDAGDDAGVSTRSADVDDGAEDASAGPGDDTGSNSGNTSVGGETTGPSEDRCGNGVIEPEVGEECDGDGAKSCSNGNALVLCVDCKWNHDDCPSCGNGVVEPGEECDTANPILCEQHEDYGGNGWLACSHECLWVYEQGECCVLTEAPCEAANANNCCDPLAECNEVEGTLRCLVNE